MATLRQYLISIGQEMAAQDNRHTQYPMFVVRDNGEYDLQAGIFFTAIACQEHIDNNLHHYEQPEVYGISAWRNPEMQAVQKHLIKLAKRDLPSHYAGPGDNRAAK